MATRMRWASRIGLAVVALLAVSGHVDAQVLVPDTTGMFTSGLQNPRFPPEGDWAEVVTVTPKWLVIQNQAGQQFPVAMDAIGQFIIRWPSSIDNISPNALVEAMGPDMASNQISTDHIDVFEGAARQLVTPTYQYLIGYNRTITQFDINNMQLGVWTPLLPGEDQIPERHHIVGTLASRYPLRIAGPGNNALTVLPSPAGMSVAEVTLGSSTFLRAGDLIYLVPANYTPRTMLLRQMVAFKTMPLSQFVP